MGIPGAGPKNYLRIIRKDAVDRQADFVGVVLFLGNDLMQAHPDSRTFAVDSANYDYAALPVDLTRDLDAAGVATLNLQSAFEARGMTEALYAKDDTHDTHWIEAGNAVAADAIWAFLRTRMGAWPRRVQIVLNGSAISKPAASV
jgi:hypothetical protein